MIFFKKGIDKSKLICYNSRALNGRLAQLGEHLPYKQRVTGSSPVLSTRTIYGIAFDADYTGSNLGLCVSKSGQLLATAEPMYFPPELAIASSTYGFGLVAQLVRALACHARGRGFEPHPSRHPVCLCSSVGRAGD